MKEVILASWHLFANDKILHRISKGIKKKTEANRLLPQDIGYNINMQKNQLYFYTPVIKIIQKENEKQFH